MNVSALNLTFAWFWMLAGFLSGLGLGLFFHREDWLGGYGTFKRRLYRLAHISFFGLGLVNLAFYLTVRLAGLARANISPASALFVIGGVLMPACCLTMAHRSAWRMVFAAPGVSLVAGVALMLWEVL